MEVDETFSFQSQRVALRAFEAEDVLALHTYLNHPELAGRRYIPWGFPGEIPLSKKQAEGIYEEWSEKEDGFVLAVVLRDSQDLIGHVECEWEWDPRTPSVSLVIAPEHQRQGHGSEVLQILLDYLFGQSPAHNVSGWMGDWNQAARQFAAKHGFQESGIWRRDSLRNGAYSNGIQVDILRSEWLAREEDINNGA
jgi:RimJ/RimL family protein N-acetyltransferase